MPAAYRSRARGLFRLALLMAVVWPSFAVAQSDLDSLVARAVASSPALRAARARVDAARMRVGPAGARPDAMLMAGVQNFPVTDPGFADFMTMKMIGVGQTLPFPGKLSLRTRAAEYEVAAASARLDEARLTVAREVRSAYYDLVFADRAFDIVRRNQEMLAALVPVSEAQYSSGTGTQADVLRLRVEAARLADEATVLRTLG
jgi:outer membrane protein, heavy metal efflux system